MEKDHTRVFIQVGTSGRVYERYPEDHRRDRQKWIDVGEVASRVDVRLGSVTNGAETAWTIHPAKGGNRLPSPLKDGEQFWTDPGDFGLVVDELESRVGTDKLTIVTS